ncbi:MAG: GTPase, partial [Fidelibacterota bacterium]
MSRPIVAILGRRNVGKSTLFNRLVGRRQAIVDSEEGITRDRIYGQVEWAGRVFTLVDTGGYVPDKARVMDEAVRKQAEMAMNEASVIILLVDGRQGMTPDDSLLGRMVKRSGRKHLLVINKIDDNKQEALQGDFFPLGFESMMSISALGGRKIGDLLDLVVESLGEPVKAEKPEREEDIRVAIVGMPNVGKSSIANALLGQEKSIVTEIPGTTRDSVDSMLKYYGRTYVLVDTAGLR